MARISGRDTSALVISNRALPADSADYLVVACQRIRTR